MSAYQCREPSSDQRDYSALRDQCKACNEFASKLENMTNRLPASVADYVDRAVKALTNAEINLNAAANQLARESRPRILT